MKSLYVEQYPRSEASVEVEVNNQISHPNMSHLNLIESSYSDDLKGMVSYNISFPTVMWRGC